MEHSESNSCSSIENRWTEVFMWLIARKAAVFFAISPLLALVAPPASASPLFPGVSASKVSVWSGPFLWVGVRVMYPHSVMWIHSSGLAGQR
jgi:hypothetical protein